MVAVGTHDDRSIEYVIECIFDERQREVDIRLLFLMLGPATTA